VERATRIASGGGLHRPQSLWPRSSMFVVKSHLNKVKASAEIRGCLQPCPTIAQYRARRTWLSVRNQHLTFRTHNAQFRKLKSYSPRLTNRDCFHHGGRWRVESRRACVIFPQLTACVRIAHARPPRPPRFLVPYFHFRVPSAARITAGS
jgi:hypothetical protein